MHRGSWSAFASDCWECWSGEAESSVRLVGFSFLPFADRWSDESFLRFQAVLWRPLWDPSDKLSQVVLPMWVLVLL